MYLVVSYHVTSVRACARGGSLRVASGWLLAVLYLQKPAHFADGGLQRSGTHAAEVGDVSRCTRVAPTAAMISERTISGPASRTRRLPAVDIPYLQGHRVHEVVRLQAPG